MNTKKSVLMNSVIIVSLLTAPSLASASWEKTNCGAMTDLGGGIVELAGSDYRAGNSALSSTVYDFTQGSETLISFMPIDGNFSAFYAVVGGPGWAVGVDGTTGWSWNGSTVLTSGTWYYARITIDNNQTETAVLSTGNYDTAGGTPIRSWVYTLTNLQWISAKVGHIIVSMGDNYSGTGTKVRIGQATTTAVPLPVPSGTEVLYDFNDGQIPTDFQVISGNWSVADQTLKLSTTGNQSSPINFPLDPLNGKAVQVSFRVRMDLILRNGGWDNEFDFHSLDDNTNELNRHAWRTSPSNSCWIDLTVRLPEGTNTLRWEYYEDNMYSGTPSPQNHQVAIDDVRVLYVPFTFTFGTTIVGTGTGNVTGSTANGIYNTGTAITLVATATNGSTFTGWSPAGCVTGMTLTANTTCTATFDLTPPAIYTLTLATDGTGTVTGGSSYVAGATVTLTATPSAGSTFVGWSPSLCAASFTMPANDLTCIATFDLTPPAIHNTTSNSHAYSSYGWYGYGNWGK